MNAPCYCGVGTCVRAPVQVSDMSLWTYQGGSSRHVQPGTTTAHRTATTLHKDTGFANPRAPCPSGASRSSDSCWQSNTFRKTFATATPGIAPQTARSNPESTNNRSVSCGVAATAGLATYAFPPQTPRVFHWFEDCIEQIVKHLDEAPFLQLVYPDRKSAFERHQVNASIVAVPQIWRSIADYLSQSQPDILVLGKVGECCDEEEDDHSHGHEHSPVSFPDRASNGVSFYQTNDKAADQDRGRFASPTGNYPELQETLQSDWGLVVQSKFHSGAEGCYVLRTTRNSNPTADCQCTHYSLTRVCQGEALGTQLGAAWLAD
ncbi:hypothetical protein WJX84_007421 [Apatococcus fuscideae]|uniref:Uncharacterized protein n=1 Tax=Apatococcus fuscideae TaxID=2026836 RepID=A0AAW1S9V3_9CHLO